MKFSLLILFYNFSFIWLGNDLKSRHRKYLTFKQNEWQTLFTDELRKKGEPCGFLFKTNKIYPASNTATFDDLGDCGSFLRRKILSLVTDVIRINCFIKPGHGGECGKRPLRGKERNKVTNYMIETSKFKITSHFNYLY